jgi:hypothetical protein
MLPFTNSTSKLLKDNSVDHTHGRLHLNSTLNLKQAHRTENKARKSQYDVNSAATTAYINNNESRPSIAINP